MKKQPVPNAVIFDFNGTMFFDSPKHEAAWRLYLKELVGREITDEEFRKSVHGKNNAGILTHFLGDAVTPQQVQTIGQEKEALYRRLCLADPASLHLAPGLELLLDRLKEKGMKLAVATSSDEKNMQFYLEQFHLERWFSPEHLIWDDGTFPGKPNPAIYQKAMKALSAAPEECAVFEDARSGLLAAIGAEAGWVIGVASSGNREELREIPGVTNVIDDFTQPVSCLSFKRKG